MRAERADLDQPRVGKLAVNKHPTAGRVQAEMKALGLSHGELARRAGCSGATMTKILQGETQQSRFLPAIARVLGVSVAYLIGETDEAIPASAAGALTTEESAFLNKVRVLSPFDKQVVFRVVDSLTRSPAK